MCMSVCKHVTELLVHTVYAVQNVGGADSCTKWLQTAVQSSRANTMWGKAREKKAARMYHTRNFGTGHVQPDEYYLRRIGLRGRKRWIFLSVVLFAYLLVTGHLVVSSDILYIHIIYFVKFRVHRIHQAHKNTPRVSVDCQLRIYVYIRGF